MKKYYFEYIAGDDYHGRTIITAPTPEDAVLKFDLFFQGKGVVKYTAY